MGLKNAREGTQEEEEVGNDIDKGDDEISIPEAVSTEKITNINSKPNGHGLSRFRKSVINVNRASQVNSLLERLRGAREGIAPPSTIHNSKSHDMKREKSKGNAKVEQNMPRSQHANATATDSVATSINHLVAASSTSVKPSTTKQKSIAHSIGHWGTTASDSESDEDADEEDHGINFSLFDSSDSD